MNTGQCSFKNENTESKVNIILYMLNKIHNPERLAHLYSLLCTNPHSCFFHIRSQTWEQAGIQPICFSVTWVLQSSAHVISHHTESDPFNCIISIGYKVTVAAPSCKWHRRQMEKGCEDLNRCWISILDPEPFLSRSKFELITTFTRLLKM